MSATKPTDPDVGKIIGTQEGYREATNFGTKVIPPLGEVCPRCQGVPGSTHECACTKDTAEKHGAAVVRWTRPSVFGGGK